MNNHKFLIPGTNTAFILSMEGEITQETVTSKKKKKNGKTVKSEKTVMDGQVKFTAALDKASVDLSISYPNGKPGTKKFEKAMKYQTKKYNAWLKRKYKQAVQSWVNKGLKKEDAEHKAEQDVKDLRQTLVEKKPKRRSKSAHNKAYAMMVSYINGKAFKRKIISMMGIAPNQIVVDYNERYQRDEEGNPKRIRVKDANGRSKGNSKIAWVSSYVPGFTVTPTNKRQPSKAQALKAKRKAAFQKRIETLEIAREKVMKIESDRAKLILKNEIASKGVKNKNHIRLQKEKEEKTTKVKPIENKQSKKAA